MKQKKQLTLLFCIACGIVLVLALKLGVFEYLELKSLDIRFRLFARPEKASPDVVLVAIDENSLRFFKENNIVWKWPRDLYAALVRYLHRGEAKVIVFDILFPDQDIDRLSSDAEQTDGAFAKAIKEAQNVFLACHLIHEENLLTGDNSLVWQSDLKIDFENEHVDFDSFSNSILPIPLFQANATGLGAVNYEEDVDGISRRVPLFFKYQNEIIPHLGIAAFLAIKDSRIIQFTPNQKVRFNNIEAPIDKKRRFLISWYGKAGPDGCFKYYSIGALISSAIAEETGQEPTLPASYFKDKIVIIGSNAAALSDFRNTPFSVYGPYPGMEIYATMISNLLQHDFLTRSSSIITVVAILIFVILVFYSFLMTHKVRYILLISFLSGTGWLTAVCWFFSQKQIWLDSIAPETAIIMAFLVSAIINYQTEGKARRHLRSTFGKYLSPVVISEVIEKTEEVELGGKELNTTIYFSDIKDFTSISEQIKPKELVVLLNEYFSVNTEIVLKHQGLLDKYIGDAIMAVFGAPIEIKNHAFLACSAALDVQQIMKKIILDESNHKPKMITRIGINTGTVVVGNIGSNLRLDYTAIGDSVNLASRLEGVNKVFSTNIIISESTHKEVANLFVTRHLDRLQVKGKQQPINIYELVGKNDEVEQNILDKIHRFHQGIDLYHKREFEKALKLFQAILSTHPEDGPALVYIKRCEQFLLSPPGEKWDGVFKMETK